MTAVGKILVFLNLLFSVLTAGLIVMVFVTRANWKNEFERVRRLAEVADKAYSVEKTEREKDRNASDEKITAFTRQLDDLNKTIAAKDKNIASLQGDLLKAQSLGNASDTNSVLAREELDRIRKEREALETEKKQRLNEIAQLRKDLDTQRQLAVQNEIAWKSATARNEKLLERNEQMAAENKQLKFQANSGGVAQGNQNLLTAPGPNAAPANVRGTVVAYIEGGLTTISIGTDNGIQQGTQLFVYRLVPDNPAASKYLGKLLIRQAKPKEAVGQFYAAAKDSPQPGDEVGPLSR